MPRNLKDVMDELKQKQQTKKERDWFTRVKVPDNPDRSAGGDWSGSSWSGERASGRNQSGGRDR
jgi:hypothetical protein